MINGCHLVGLTGGIGSGKSTLARMLEMYPDVIMLQCDGIAKEIMFDPAGFPALREIFGDEIFADHGINIPKFTEVLFADDEKRMKLESFVHSRRLSVSGRRMGWMSVAVKAPERISLLKVRPVLSASALIMVFLLF